MKTVYVLLANDSDLGILVLGVSEDKEKLKEKLKEYDSETIELSFIREAKFLK